MTAVRPKVRLHLPGPLAAGHLAPLAPAQVHYVATVMRLADGAALAVFNAADGEWLARLAFSGRRAAAAVPERRVRPPRPEPGPWLVFAPVKKAALDVIVEKATELGAERLWPVLTARTVAGRVNLERLRAQAVEAAEQCERLSVPEVAVPLPLSRLAAAWPAERPLLILSEHGGRPLAEAVRAVPAGPAPGFLVGPEGGFPPSELDALTALPFGAPVALGPRILRAETAALAALACWQALAGDWTQPPPLRGP